MAQELPNIQSHNSYRNILQVALPMALAIMIPQISILANAIFLGNYTSTDGLIEGKNVLAVVGVAGIFYLVFAMTLFGLASGMLMLMSRQAGDNNHKGVGVYYSNGMILGLFFSLLLLVFSYFFAPYFFSWTLEDNLIETLAVQFMNIRIWGLPFIFIAHLGNMLFVSTNNTKLMLYGTLGQTIVQILLDYVLIYGHWGCAEMGIEGAAWASVAAEFTFFMVVYGLIYFMPRFKVYAINIFRSFDMALIKESFVKSSPLMMQFMISIGSWEVFFIYIEHLGENELAASHILRSVYGMVGIFVWALANTANSMVSNIYAQKRFDDIIPLIKRIVIMSLSYAAIISIIILTFSDYFLSFYTSDTQVLALASTTLITVVIASLLFSVSTIYFNSLLGMGKTKRNLVYELIVIVAYLIYCTIVIEQLRLPLWVAWSSEFVYWIFILSLCANYIHSKKWVY